MRGISIIGFVCVQIASFALATQVTALAFAHHSALGAPAVRMGETNLYWPWSMLVWASEWRDSHPRMFAAGDAMIVLGWVAGLLVARLR